MKILFANRADCLLNKGGDTVQLLKTKSFLEKIFGVTIKIILRADDIQKYPDYDLVHIFNIQTAEQTLEFVKAAKILNMPIVLSPIYWNLWHSFVIAKSYKLLDSRVYRFLSRFEFLGRFLWMFMPKKHESYLSSNYRKRGRLILEQVDCLLPNSFEEFKTLCTDFGLSDKQNAILESKVVAVPNAIEKSQIKNDINFDIDSNDVICNVKNYVLVVGRIEPNKNQLGVLLALMDDRDIQIVFVGRPSGDRIGSEYYRYVNALAEKRGNVFFIAEMPHEKLNSIYANAAVHVLASFRESPGLVTLEALNFGCRIVFSSREFCPVDYYKLEQFGTACNPYDISSIRSAIKLELSSSNKNDTSNYFEFYSYENAAKITYNAYLNLLKSKQN